MSGALISATELRGLLDGDRPPLVLDATLLLGRPRHDGDHTSASGAERWRAAHIPGSLHVDLATDFSDPTAPWHYTHADAQTIADTLAAFGADSDRLVVTLDSAGGLWAARLWWLLRWIGQDVAVLDGGLAAWQAVGGALTSEATEPAPVPARPVGPVRDAWITQVQLLELLARSDAPPLICALSGSAFAGAEPTRYSRRGHIPGSLSLPARTLFDGDGRAAEPAAIAAAFAAIGVETATGLRNGIVLYCGGGISAALDALALAVLGVDDVRIYDGSLEEWSADDALPLVTLTA